MQNPPLSRCIEHDSRNFTARIHEQNIDGSKSSLFMRSASMSQFQ
jgi:hypothetical protein